MGINKIVRSGQDFLTYATDDAGLGVGSIVSVPVGRTTASGVIFEEVARPSFTCKKIIGPILPEKLPHHLIKAMLWLSQYYFSPIALILQSVVPTNVTKNNRGQNAHAVTFNINNIQLNNDQKAVIKKVEQFAGNTFLLHGITGSGKTNVYLELARKTLIGGKSVIVLVPEIALSSQINDRFGQIFGERVVEIHSRQTPAQRRKIWQGILSSDQPMIVIGPRSALFAPVHHLGLIIVDEAHESSYRQDKTPKYNALRLASEMARQGGFKAILGTATPLVADYAYAKAKAALGQLKAQAIDHQTKVEITTVDMTKKDQFSRHRFLSDALLKSITNSLKNGQQALIFHNRRGSSNLIACESCGYQSLCPRCHMPMTLHHDRFGIICHLCGHKAPVLTSCPDCGSPKIVYKGFGTKTVEEELRKLFRDQKIARFDSDTASEMTMNKLYDQVKSGEYSIIIGTQTIAKGFDLPNLSTVGILQADSGLAMPDFMSNERVFELLTQVIGRVGRGHTDKAEVIIQTYQPDNPIIQMATSQNYTDFANLTLKQRRRDFFPPYAHLLKLICSYKTEALAIKNCQEIAVKIKNIDPDLKIFGPAPAFYEIINKKYRWQIVVKSPRRQKLLDLLKNLSLPPAHRQIDLDPFNLL